ncbi:DnaJ-domain-containing protein [Mycena rebaudengoi]|nr:DnaJ-domain-containing protein [Mycena rebaudengoi]
MVPLLSILGWSFIPHQATKQALNILHQLSFKFFGIRAPPAGSPEYKRHYRYTFATVILGYLMYTLIQGANSTPPNYYEILGVAPSADENDLKLAFRQFAKKYHPDRVGPQGEALFISVRDAFEALKNPTVRFAYDRFGPDVLAWTHCRTTGEYLRHGLTQSIGYHVVAGAVLVFWTAIGETSPVAFWRYLLYVSLFASELALLLSPSPSPASGSMLLSPFTHPAAGPTHRTILHVIFPRRVAYQHILFLHQIFLFMSIALSRVAPQFFPDTSKLTDAVAQKLVGLINTFDRDTSQILHMELHSLHEHKPLAVLRPLAQPSEDVMDMLSTEMEKMIIEGTVKQPGGPFKSVWEAAVEKGKRAAELARDLPLTPIKNFWSTPASPFPSLAPRMVNGDSKPSPNPRMSPPPVPRPALDRSTSSYVRARSVSTSY